MARIPFLPVDCGADLAAGFGGVCTARPLSDVYPPPNVPGFAVPGDELAQRDVACATKRRETGRLVAKSDGRHLGCELPGENA